MPARCGAAAKSRTRKFLVFLLKGVFDDCLGVAIPMRQAAVIADPHWDVSPTENIPLVAQLSECDQLIAGGHTAGLAKITTLDAFRVEHCFLHDLFCGDGVFRMAFPEVV
jgi:hypothetical protein